MSMTQSNEPSKNYKSMPENTVIRHPITSMPVPVTIKKFSATEAMEMITNSLYGKYQGQFIDEEDPDAPVLEKRFQGMTNAEVMSQRLVEGAAAGELPFIKEVLDRTMGKPKQYVESVSMNMTYEDFLENLAKKNEADMQAYNDAFITNNYLDEL